MVQIRLVPVVTALLLLMTVTLVFPRLATGSTQDVKICHWKENRQRWKLRKVTERRAERLLRNHDDARPGEYTTKSNTLLDEKCREVMPDDAPKAPVTICHAKGDGRGWESRTVSYDAHLRHLANTDCGLPGQRTQVTQTLLDDACKQVIGAAGQGGDGVTCRCLDGKRGRPLRGAQWDRCDWDRRRHLTPE